MKNFGLIKEYITKQLTQSLLNEDVDKRKLFENFIKEIKNSNILKTQYFVYNNIENKYIKDENKATRYINENIALFNKFNYKDLINENNKLFDKFIIKEDINKNDECPCTLKLYENLDILIKESTKNQSDPQRKYDSFECVLEYVTTEDTSKKEDDKYKLNNNTYFSNNKIIEMAINKFNDKYSYFNDNEKQIFKVLFENDKSGKEKVFNKIKKDNLNQVKRKIVESNDPELSDKLKLVENKLSSMVYSENNYIEDVVKLNKLNGGF